MRHHHRALGTVRPEPDERNAIDVELTHAETEHVTQQRVDTYVHRPAWEHNPLPAAQANLLEMLANPDAEHWASRSSTHVEPRGRM